MTEMQTISVSETESRPQVPVGPTQVHMYVNLKSLCISQTDKSHEGIGGLGFFLTPTQHHLHAFK